MYKIKIHVGVIRTLVYGLSLCTEDNPLAIAKARGLFYRTDNEQTTSGKVAAVESLEKSPQIYNVRNIVTTLAPSLLI